MPTRVVNLHREHYDVYIGRAGRGHDGYFGNPFPLAPNASDAERKACLDRFREHFLFKIASEPKYAARVFALRGKVLGCFCKPRDCHGDIIARYIDAATCEECGAPATHISNNGLENHNHKAYCDDCHNSDDD